MGSYQSWIELAKHYPIHEVAIGRYFPFLSVDLMHHFLIDLKSAHGAVILYISNKDLSAFVPAFDTLEDFLYETITCNNTGQDMNILKHNLPEYAPSRFSQLAPPERE